MGAYAVYEGLVVPCEPITIVRVFNTNLNRVLRIEVPVSGKRPVERGDYVVPGVPGSGARILIDFSDTAGGATGNLLPTGNPRDRLAVEGVGEIDVSLIDIGNAHVFIRAADVGLKGTETAAEIDADTGLRAKLEKIRGAAAYRMGLATAPDRARDETPAAPLLGMVSAPADYRNVIGDNMVRAEEVDLVSRLMFMQQMHKTYAGTSTVATGVAARLEGTLVHEMARTDRRNAKDVRIGHPAGVIETETDISLIGDNITVRRATLGRTARRLMEGYAFVPDA